MKFKQQLLVKFTTLTGLFFLVIGGIGSVVMRFAQINLLEDALESFENTRFAEAYGSTTCHFDGSYTLNTDYIALNSDWTTGVTATPVTTTTTTLNVPFTYRFAGDATDTITVESRETLSGAAFGSPNRDIDHETYLYPNFQAYGTDDYVLYGLSEFRQDGVGNEIIEGNVGGTIPGDYFLRKEAEIETKSFTLNGRDVFGLKLDYFTPENAPIAYKDTQVRALHGQTTTIYPIHDLADINSDTITLTNSFTQPTNGVVVLDAGNTTFSYTPNNGFAGTDSFTYEVTDGNGGFLTNTAQIEVRSVYGSDDFYNLSSGSHTLNVLENDYVEDVNNVSVAITAGPTTFNGGSAWGSASVNPDNTITINTGPSFAGSFDGRLTYSVTNNTTGEVVTAEVEFNLDGTNPLTNTSSASNNGINELFYDEVYIDADDSVSVVRPLRTAWLYDPNVTVEITSTDNSNFQNSITINPDNTLSIDMDTLNGDIGGGRIFYTTRDSQGRALGTQELHIELTYDKSYSEYIYIEDQSYGITRMVVNNDPRSIIASGDESFALFAAGGDSFNFSSGGQYNGNNGADISFPSQFQPVGTLLGAGDGTNYPGNCEITAFNLFRRASNINPITIDAIGDINLVSQISFYNGSDADYDYENYKDQTVHPLSIDSFTQPSQAGTVTLNPDNTLTFTPTDNTFSGTVSFSYTVRDTSTRADIDNSNTSSANVTIAISDNNPPSTEPDFVQTSVDTSILIDVLDNDSDLDGEALTVTFVNTPVQGSAVIENGQVRYTPPNGYTGDQHFKYAVSDGNDTVTEYIHVTVGAAPVNADPDAVDDNATVNENSTILVDVLSNDTDTDTGDTLTIDSVSTPANGTAVIENGQVRYTPTLGYFGSDSFTYTISDGNGGSDTATVNLTVSEQNVAPDADDDSATLDEDTDILIDVLANDTDPDIGQGVSTDALVIDSVSTPSNGTAVIENGQVRYTPSAHYNGSDSFTYTVSDGNGGSDTATVSITVDPVNDDPDAVDDTATVDENTNILIDVLSNDSDPVENDALTIDSVSTPANGTAVIENGQVRYTPTLGYFGSDSFTYTISDGNGGSDSATVTVTVNEVNSDPDAIDDSVTVNENAHILVDVLANDTDTDSGDTLVIDSVSTPTNGTATIENGQVRYTPTPSYFGSDSFTYTVSDGNGGNDTATVSVTVLEANNPPVAVDDTASMDEDATPILIDVLANDSDSDIGLGGSTDALSIVSITQPVEGQAAIENGQLRYTPPANYNGPATFRYTIEDGNGGSSSAFVTVTVNPINDDPVAQDDVATLNENTSILVDVLVNDSDPIENDTLSVDSVSTPANGTAVIENGQVRYTPTVDYVGSDSFTYTMTDGNGGFDTATVTLTVQEVNSNTAPVAQDDTATLEQDSQLLIDVLANDSDIDIDDVISIQLISQPTNGSAQIENAQIRYIPTAGYFGSDSFSYTIEDTSGAVATATVNLTIAELKSLQLDITKSTDETLAVGETLQVQVSTINPNTANLSQVTTVVTFDSSRFEYVEGSLRRGSITTASILDVLSLPVDAQNDDLNATVDGDTITIEYSVIEGGEQEDIIFELASRVVGEAQINGTTSTPEGLESSDSEDAEIVLTSVPTPRTGGVIMVAILALISAGSVGLYVISQRRKLNVNTK